MSKTVIHTPKAPAAIGAYSQAVRAGNTVYLSGQIPLAPETMQLVGDDFEAQAHQVFKNLRAVCETAGGSLNDIVEAQRLSHRFVPLRHLQRRDGTILRCPLPCSRRRWRRLVATRRIGGSRSRFGFALM